MNDALCRLYAQVCDLHRHHPPDDLDAVMQDHMGDSAFMEKMVAQEIAHGRSAIRALAALQGDPAQTDKVLHVTRADAIACVAHHVRQFLIEQSVGARRATREQVLGALEHIRPDPGSELAHAVAVLAPFGWLTVCRIQWCVRGVSV